MVAASPANKKILDRGVARTPSDVHRTLADALPSWRPTQAGHFHSEGTIVAAARCDWRRVCTAPRRHHGTGSISSHSSQADIAQRSFVYPRRLTTKRCRGSGGRQSSSWSGRCEYYYRTPSQQTVSCVVYAVCVCVCRQCVVRLRSESSTRWNCRNRLIDTQQNVAENATEALCWNRLSPLSHPVE